MKNKNFGVFILTHGRPDRVFTVKALKNVGYTGPIFFLCDDEDESLPAYKKKYGDAVHVFCKQEWLDKSDVMDAAEGPRSIVLPARNYCFELAKKLGLDYFLELDDDYKSFQVKGIRNGQLHDFRKFKTFDEVCDKYIDFLNANEHILTVCFFQNGDYIGGLAGTCFKNKIRFKAMNSFFCKTSRPFQFAGRLNEDLTMSVIEGMRGNLCLTVGDMTLSQLQTQSNAGGLTDAYLEMGTYRKSFYSVIAAPAVVRISTMGDFYKRIHHKVDWSHAHPYILSERWKKKV